MRYLTQPVYIKELLHGACQSEQSGKPEPDGFARFSGTVFFIQHIRCEENGAVHDISQCRRKPEQLDCFDNLQVGAHRGETDPYE